MARGNRQDLYLSVNGDVRGLQNTVKVGRTVLNEFAGTAVNVLEEVEKQFQKIGAGGPPAGLKEAERAYTESFRRIGASAREAAKAPAGQAAIQILDANASRQAAEAATNKAAALRIVAEAASRADQATGGTSAATRAYAAAAASAAVEANAEAAALREQAGVLGTVEAQLGRYAVTQVRSKEITGQQRTGYQQLAYNLGDVSTQYSMGTAASIIFAQQSAQVIQAIQLIAGESKGLLGALGGGWGLVFTSALIVAAPLVSKLFEGADASDEFAGKALTLEKALEKERFATEAARKALVDYNAEKKTAAANDSLAAENALRNANARLRDALATREQIKAQIDKILVDESAARGLGGGQLLIGAATGNAAYVQAEADIKLLRETIRNLNIDIAGPAAKAAADPIAAINLQYDRMADAAKRAARGNDELARSLTKTLSAIEVKRAADLKAKQGEEAANTRAAKAGPLTTFLSPVSGRISGRFKEQRTGHQHAGLDYAVPVGTPVRAPAAGTIDVAGAKQGYGNAIYINFGGGTTARFGHLSKFNVKPGDKVEAGDVIGYSGGEPGAPGAGTSTGAHLHYEVRRGGKAVDPRTGKFPTDAAGVGDSAANRQEAAERRRKAEEDRKTQNADAYSSLLSQAKEGQYRAERSRVATIEESARLDVEAVERQRADLDRAAQKGVELDRWTQAEADAVKLINAQNASTEVAAIRERERAAAVTRRAEIEQDALEDQTSLLRLQGDLATTAADRRAIARQLLKIEQDQVEIALRAQIANERDPDRRAALEKRLEQTPKEYALRGEQLERQNDDPLQAYGRSLVDATSDMDEALKGVAANGFKALEDASSAAAASAITDLLKIGGVAGSVINGIIQDLIRLAIQKAIVSAIGKSFFGLKDGGLIPAYADGGIPGYAGGGMPSIDQGIIRGPGTGRSDSILALVGGRRPIMVSNGEGIVNERAVQQYWPIIDAMNKGTFPRFADGGLPSLPSYPSIAAAQRGLQAPATTRPLVFDLRGAVLTADLLTQMETIAAQTSGAVVREAAPAIVQAATGSTMAQLGRASL